MNFAKPIFCHTVLSALVLGGCVDSPYPATWPEPLPVSFADCPDLTGSYRNSGVEGDGSTAILARLFFSIGMNEPGLTHYELTAVSHLTLVSLDTGALTVEAWVGDELYEELQLAAEQVPCRDGKITYSDSTWHAGGVPPFLPIVYHSSIEHGISLGTDGSLVMENNEFSAGAALIIPIGIKARYWYRFAPVGTEVPGYHEESLPRGVRSTPGPSFPLEPPEAAAPWTGYDLARNCLDRAVSSNGVADPRAPALLAGRYTQDFFIQYGEAGELLPTGTVVGNNWLPGTHGLRIQKLHWQVPAIADNYVICLLDEGYRWAENDSVGQP